MERPGRPWNHNLHHHPWLLARLPAAGARVLDVGCGEGHLVADLSRRSAYAVGIDRDAPVLAAARSMAGRPNVALVRADLLTHPFRPGSFDAVVSIATLHHMDMAAGLTAMADLVRPGGSLIVVGLARSRRPVDFLADLAGVVAHRWHRRDRVFAPVAAPIVWPPPLTYRQVRATSATLLPGMRYRRHVMWRYSIEWTKPG